MALQQLNQVVKHRAIFRLTLQAVALQQLNQVVEQFWAEIADQLPVIEALYEETNCVLDRLRVRESVTPHNGTRTPTAC